MPTPSSHSQVIPKSFPKRDGTPGESGRSVVPSPYGERPLRDHVGERPKTPGTTRPEGTTWAWVCSWQSMAGGTTQNRYFDTIEQAERWAAKQLPEKKPLHRMFVIWEMP